MTARTRVCSGRRFRPALRLAAFGAWVLAGCDTADMGIDANPVPLLLAAEPAVIPSGSGPVEIEVSGLGFVPDAEVRWNGVARPTTYFDPTRLVAAVDASDVEVAGTVAISVINPAPGGGQSSPLEIVVGNPRPTLSSLWPTAAPAVLTTRLELRATGEDFATTPPIATVHWDGIPLPTVVEGAAELVAFVPDYLLRTGRTAAVTVSNPGPGGGVSNALSFGVENPVPVVDRIEPGGVTANADSELEVHGSGFVQGTAVSIDGSTLTPLVVSGPRLTVLVPANLAIVGDTLALTVQNPAPGGGTSDVLDVVVWERPPRIDNTFPSRVYAGAPDFSVVILGAFFDPAAIVTWDGAVRPATIVNSEQIEVALSASDAAIEGTYEISVINPGAGGAASIDFVVIPALPTPLVVSEQWGSQVAVVSRLDGSEAISFASESMARVDASPLGPSFVYHGNSRVHELDPRTGVPRRVTTSAENSVLDREEWARYSTDGSWIYFTGHPIAGWPQIWRARVDGTGAEAVASLPSVGVGYPAPAHDGRRIVYSRLDAYDAGGPLFIYDVISRVATPLNVSGLTSRWSPSDDWIVYLTPSWDLRAIRPDGTGGFQVVPELDVGHGFDFSPDGNYIVGTTQSGEGILISFPSGNVEYLTGLGTIGSIAIFGP